MPGLWWSGFFNCGCVDNPGWIILCCGGCPGHCGMFSGSLGLHLLNASSPSLPSCENQKCLHTLPHIPWLSAICLSGGVKEHSWPWARRMRNQSKETKAQGLTRQRRSNCQHFFACLPPVPTTSRVADNFCFLSTHPAWPSLATSFGEPHMRGGWPCLAYLAFV